MGTVGIRGVSLSTAFSLPPSQPFAHARAHAPTNAQRRRRGHAPGNAVGVEAAGPAEPLHEPVRVAAFTTVSEGETDTKAEGGAVLTLPLFGEVGWMVSRTPVFRTGWTVWCYSGIAGARSPKRGLTGVKRRVTLPSRWP